jgi:hexose-6-phosphate dehydrogenase
VDHYLGKIGMRAIIEFRRLNADILKTLHFPTLRTPSTAFSSDDESGFIRGGSEVPLVEVVMKEREHTAGRSSYYDSFGVIRDVMQNHLTQALVYSLMHVGDNGADEVEDFGAFGRF